MHKQIAVRHTHTHITVWVVDRGTRLDLHKVFIAQGIDFVWLCEFAHSRHTFNRFQIKPRLQRHFPYTAFFGVSFPDFFQRLFFVREAKRDFPQRIFHLEDSLKYFFSLILKKLFFAITNGRFFSLRHFDR